MRAGLLIVGVMLLIIGILMMLLFWPIIGFETKDSFAMEDAKSKETLRYVGEISDITETGNIFILELDDGVLVAYTKEKDFELEDRVQVTITFGDNATNWDENSYLVEKIPTSLGFSGTITLFFGLIIISVGAVTKKLTVEDIVQFNIEPRVDAIQQQEQVTCPKCKKIFPVPTTPRPAKITCPECGIKGRLD